MLLLFKSSEPVSARLIEQTRPSGCCAATAIYLRGRDPPGARATTAWSTSRWQRAIPGRSAGLQRRAQRRREHRRLASRDLQHPRHRHLGRHRPLQDVDRQQRIRLLNPAPGTWASGLLARHQQRRQPRRRLAGAALLRARCALDAGVSALDDKRIDSVYDAGEVVAQYRHARAAAELFGGLSPGLVDWVQQYSLGWRCRDDSLRARAGWSRRPRCRDQRSRAPFVRYWSWWKIVFDAGQLQPDRPPGFFALGLAKLLARQGHRRPQLDAAARGSTGSIGRGFDPWPEHRRWHERRSAARSTTDGCSASASARRRSTTCRKAGAMLRGR